jgi:hypothetical protein
MRNLVILMMLIGVGCVPIEKVPKTNTFSMCSKTIVDKGITYRVSKVTIINVDTLKKK